MGLASGPQGRFRGDPEALTDLPLGAGPPNLTDENVTGPPQSDGCSAGCSHCSVVQTHYVCSASRDASIAPIAGTFMSTYIVRCLAVTACVAFILGAVQPAAAIGRQPGFERRAGDALFDLGGVWLSRGYGWLWVVEDGGLTAYDYAPGICIRKRRYGGLPGHASDNILVRQDNRAIRLSLGDPTYLFTFDRLDALPGACREAPRTDALSVYDATAALFSAHYAFFAARGIDWASRTRTFRKRLTPQSDDTTLFASLSGLLSKIDDGHVSLDARIDGRPVSYEPERRERPIVPAADSRQQTIGSWTRDIGVELVTGELTRMGDDRVTYGLIGDDVGYLSVATTGRGLRRALGDDDAIARARRLFSGRKALVIDVSKNFGGADSVARKLASLFTRTRVVGYYKYPGDGTGEIPQPITVPPTTGPLLFDGPIYLITSRSTISAAEILVMCLRALPNVVHIGAATRGSLSDVLNKPLPNGWSISLSNEVYLDADRKAWEGRGIPPHIAFNVYRDQRDAGGDAVEAARRLVAFISKLPSRDGRLRAEQR